MTKMMNLKDIVLDGGRVYVRTAKVSHLANGYYEIL